MRSQKGKRGNSVNFGFELDESHIQPNVARERKSNEGNTVPFADGRTQGDIDDNNAKDSSDKSTIEGPNSYDSHDEQLENHICADSIVHAPISRGNVAKVKDILLKDKNAVNELSMCGYTPLHIAAEYGRFDIMELLIEYGAEIDAKGKKDGVTPLHCAVENNQLLAAKYLYKKLAYVFVPDYKGRTVLHKAAENNFHHMLLYLMSLPGANDHIDGKDEEKRVPLHYAVQNNCYESVKLLVERTKAIDAFDANNKTPLDIAAEYNRIPIMELLMREDSDYVRRDMCRKDTSLTTLENACLCGNIDAIEILTNTGNIKDHKKRLYPIHRACQHGDLDKLSYWFEKGANLDTKDYGGFTPLMVAIEHHNQKVVKFLVKNNANLYMTNRKSQNCLHIAVESFDVQDIDCSSKILRYLVRKGANWFINSVDENHWTPIHYAAKEGKKEALSILLEAATFMEGDTEGITPLHVAADYGQLECVRILVNRCWYNHPISDIVNLKARDCEQSTALKLAAKRSYGEICALLLEKGGKIRDLESTEDRCFIEIFEFLMTTHSQYESSKDNDNKLNFDLVHDEIQCLKSLMLIEENEGRRLIESIEERQRKKSDAPFGTLQRFNNEPPNMNMYKEAMSKKRVAKGRGQNLEQRWAKITADHLRKQIYRVLEENQSKIGGNEVIEALKRDMNERKGEQNNVIMKQLIKLVPNVAEYVLDKSIKGEEGKRIYNFELINARHEKETEEPFFAPIAMKRYNPQLLYHPLTKRLLKSKWNRLSLPWFALGNVSYMIFLALLTSLVLLEKGHERSHMINGTLNITKFYMSDDAKHEHVETLSWIILLLTIFQVLKEIVHFRYARVTYIREPTNFLEVFAYFFTFVFLGPFMRRSNIIESEDLGFNYLQRWKWEAGALAILIGWITMVLYVKSIPALGIIVWMFEEVVQTVVKVILALMCLIIAFAGCFYILLSSSLYHYDAYGRAVMKTVRLTFGEFEFDTMYKDGGLKYEGLTMFIFVIFLMVMPIVLMNLLVGLAVGDIEGVKASAYDRHINNQVTELENFNKSFPKFFLRKMYTKTDVANPVSWWQRFRDYTSIDSYREKRRWEPSMTAMLGGEMKTLKNNQNNSDIEDVQFNPILNAESTLAMKVL